MWGTERREETESTKAIEDCSRERDEIFFVPQELTTGILHPG